MSQSKKAKAARPSPAPPAAEQDPADEVIHVPKGHSRLKFYLILGLTIFLLIIFVVPEAFLGTAGRGPADHEYLRWRGMDGRKHSLSRNDFFTEKQRFAFLGDQMMQSLGIGAGRLQHDEDAARLIVLDQLAREWGIEITDRELVRTLRAFFGPDLAGYDGYIRSVRTLSKASFEETLRRALRISRFEALVAAGVAMPDPERLVDMWQERHLEHAFDYIEVLTERYVEEARAELPADEELEAWLLARSEVERARFMSPERFTAEVAYLPLDGELALDALLEEHPLPEDRGAEELARDYHGRFMHVRFPRPPRPEPGDEDDVAGPPAPEDEERLYATFEEAEERALAEAPAYFAMTDWVADMRRRVTEGAEIDLLEEAVERGLAYERADTPRSREEWQELEAPYAGRFTVSAQQNVQPGQLVPRVVVEEDAIVVMRVLERLPRVLPPFAEIRESVAEAWSKSHAGEVAQRRLRELRERALATGSDDEAPESAGETTVSPERFRELAAEAGFEVQHRDFRERSYEPAPGEEPTAFESYLRVTTAPFALEEGELSQPALNRAGTHAFLVRHAGVRDPDPERMQPADYAMLRQYLEEERVRDFLASTYRSLAFLEARHDLWLYRHQEQEEERAER